MSHEYTKRTYKARDNFHDNVNNGKELFRRNKLHESCDFEQCIKNKDGTCFANDNDECPKNNEYSVYENLNLIKEGI